MINLIRIVSQWIDDNHINNIYLDEWKTNHKPCASIVLLTNAIPAELHIGLVRSQDVIIYDALDTVSNLPVTDIKLNSANPQFFNELESALEPWISYGVETSKLRLS